ncbi:IS91 family transposase, partial [Solitalea koreensis]
MQAGLEVADVLRQLGQEIETIGLNTWQLRTLSALKTCRTAALGGHVDACSDCGTIRISYNSCRNRHCPKCQGHHRENWIQARRTELLPVPYFHVVFTLPGELNALALQQPKLLYDTLFSAAWKTLSAFGKEKSVQTGMIAILHTWGQNLSLHPHIHCIVPGGGIGKDKHWSNIRRDGKFLFSVKAMSKVFRAKYVAELSAAGKLDKTLREQLFAKPWVVYAKRPFGNEQSVIEYLGRYTHKIAISNHRLLGVDKAGVRFSYKDYKDQGKKKIMTLPHAEFVRRFAQHILPKRFVKIRHYGFLSSTWKRQKLKDLQQNLNVKPADTKVKSVYRS